MPVDPEDKPEEFPFAFYKWQEELMEEFLEPAHDRKIIWYTDTKGGAGKT